MERSRPESVQNISASISLPIYLSPDTLRERRLPVLHASLLRLHQHPERLARL